MNPGVSIVILNWNGSEDTIECLESLYQINYPKYDIIIVDNGSEDDSIKKIKEYFGNNKFSSYAEANMPVNVFEYTKKDIETGIKLENDFKACKNTVIIKNDKNEGFAEGNNIGMRFALENLNSDYILLLNNDTIVNKDFLDPLVNIAENDALVGMVGPKIYYYDTPNKINAAGGKIIWHLGAGVNIGSGKDDKGEFDEILEMDYLMGACILIRKDLIKKIGNFDKNLFLLFEDTDLCIRAKKAGYKMIYTPESSIYHKEGISAKKSPIKLYYMYRNRIILIRKHQKVIKEFIFLFYISGRSITASMINCLFGDFETGKIIAKGVLSGLKTKIR
ncbi:glycosyltransferase family 2 protein [Methanobacterium sp.]|uniref:glycosyltransferase family 2 protein n=1 Tax=Methanobacterium sp. TaxID=2164 RepID=UPI003C772DE8